MTVTRFMMLPALCAAALATSAAAPVPLSGLDRLEHGAWEVRARGVGGDVQKLCVGDPRQLLQVRHLGTNCSRYVVTDTPDAVTVTYNCPGAGNGRTDLRIETTRLVQIESQGIANRAPFSVSLEARRVGDCS